MRDQTKTPKLLLGLVGAFFALVVTLVLVLSGEVPSTSGHQIGLDELGRLSGSHLVAHATFLDQDNRVTLRVRTATGGAPYTAWSAYPANGSEVGALVSNLVAGGATVTVDQQSAKRILGLIGEFILPLLLLADLFGIFILLARGGSSQVAELFAFSRIANKRDGESTSSVRFGDVAASAETVAELTEVRDYLRDPARFASMGAVPPKGILLHGPPGCGKTLLARALAGEAGVPFMSMSGSEFVESLVGVGAARVRDLFRQAKATAPAIIFVDELDAAGRRRGAGIGGGNDEREQTLNELLVQMDGFNPASGVLVIAATNRPDILDPALVRPGRFDRHISVDAPDVNGRVEILDLHSKGRRFDDDADMEEVAASTAGFTGADLASVINEAALLAVRRHGSGISAADLDEAIDRVVAGPQRRGRLLDDDERERLALHEAGHAVVAARAGLADDVRRLSIVARGRNAGHASFVRSDRTVLTRDEMALQLTILMAGTAAEEVVLGQSSTAGENDLEAATTLARHMAGRYGMSEEVGLVRLLAPESEVFLGRDYLSAQHVSPTTLAEVESAVRNLVEEARANARRALMASRPVLERIARELAEAETLDQEELAALLAPASRRRTQTLEMEEAAAVSGSSATTPRKARPATKARTAPSRQ